MVQNTKSKLLFTILSISLLTVMAGAAMAPALGVIHQHFKNESSLMVQLIVSIPALFIILTNLFFPWFCKLMKIRTLALLGLCMYIVFGAGAFFATNIGMVLLLRALLGVSVGMIMPLSTGLLAYYFPPEDQARLMGLAAFMSQLGGVVATFLSGFLCTLGWNYSFLVYLLGIFALVLVVMYLPNDRLTTGEKTMKHSPDYYESSEGVTKARKVSGHPVSSLARFAPSIIGMFLLMVLFFIFPTNFAITALANPKMNPQTITLIMVGLDVIAAIVGLVFGKLMRAFPYSMKYIAPIGFTLGFACLSIGTDLFWLLFGSFILGIANGVGIPYLNTIASIKGGRDAATTVMPLISAAMFMGQFISPLVVSPCAKFLGCVTAPYTVGVLIGIIFIIQAWVSRKYQALAPA